MTGPSFGILKVPRGRISLKKMLMINLKNRMARSSCGRWLTAKTEQMFSTRANCTASPLPDSQTKADILKQFVQTDTQRNEAGIMERWAGRELHKVAL